MLLPGDVKPYSLSRSCQESKLPVWRCADMPSYHPYVINTDTKKCWWRRWRFLQWIMFCWRGERLRQSCRTTQTAAEAEAWNRWQYTASRWTASVMHFFHSLYRVFQKKRPCGLLSVFLQHLRLDLKCLLIKTKHLPVGFQASAFNYLENNAIFFIIVA